MPPGLPPQAPRAMPAGRPGGNFNGPVGGMPGGSQPGGFDTGAAYNQTSGFSEHQKIQRSVAKSKRNAGVLKSVKLSRQQLEQWLTQFGLKLLTSSVELQLTHNFLNSSYVIYPDGSKVALPLFLKQTDQSIQSIAQQISNNLTGIASQLEVIDPYANQNPFDMQYGNMATINGIPVPASQPNYYPQPQPNYPQAPVNYYPPQPNYPQYPQNGYPQPQPNVYPNQNYYPQPQNNNLNQQPQAYPSPLPPAQIQLPPNIYPPQP